MVLLRRKRYEKEYEMEDYTTQYVIDDTDRNRKYHLQVCDECGIPFHVKRRSEGKIWGRDVIGSHAGFKFQCSKERASSTLAAPTTSFP